MATKIERHRVQVVAALFAEERRRLAKEALRLLGGARRHEQRIENAHERARSLGKCRGERRADRRGVDAIGERMIDRQHAAVDGTGDDARRNVVDDVLRAGVRLRQGFAGAESFAQRDGAPLGDDEIAAEPDEQHRDRQRRRGDAIDDRALVPVEYGGRADARDGPSPAALDIHRGEDGDRLAVAEPERARLGCGEMAQSALSAAHGGEQPRRRRRARRIERLRRRQQNRVHRRRRLSVGVDDDDARRVVARQKPHLREERAGIDGERDDRGAIAMALGQRQREPTEPPAADAERPSRQRVARRNTQRFGRQSRQLGRHVGGARIGRRGIDDREHHAPIAVVDRGHPVFAHRGHDRRDLVAATRSARCVADEAGEQSQIRPDVRDVVVHQPRELVDSIALRGFELCDYVGAGLVHESHGGDADADQRQRQDDQGHGRGSRHRVASLQFAKFIGRLPIVRRGKASIGHVLADDVPRRRASLCHGLAARPVARFVLCATCVASPFAVLRP